MSDHLHLCIHGHFYQPPREDPFTHLIPDESGAAPYHNYNEKITTECYRANAEAGNFGRISYNVGPTLALWLARQAPDIALRMVESDQRYRALHGVGNALAQAYNHTILPLATSRDKRTQIAWGVADFRHRYGRDPKGMWLGETAADLETLTALADHGIAFTILAPWQAATPIDPTEPYWVRLADGRRIAVFFYHQTISGAVSFEDQVTTNADAFAAGYLPRFVNHDKEARGEDQIVLVATDGELYGHHKLFRDRFLDRLGRHSAPAFGFAMTSLERYLRDHPPTREVAIVDRTSWSCAHGVDRWSAGCSCTEGDASWKAPLRRAITRMGERIDQLFERYGAQTLADPWAARDAAIEWRSGWLDAGAFWQRYGLRHRPPTSMAQAVRTWHLLEAQYHMQASATSCGWFFEDLERIEPRNNINFARRAISHVWQALHADVQADFIADLAAAQSWRTGATGADIYRALPAPPGHDMLPPITLAQSTGHSAA